MFLGEFKQSIDKNGKLKLPKSFSVHLAAGLVMTRGFEHNLVIYTRLGWQRLAEKVIDQSIFSRDSRALRRRLFANAAELAPDRSGQITIPDSLRQFAGIEDEAVITGMFDFVEIWSPQNWSEAGAQVDDVLAGSGL